MNIEILIDYANSLKGAEVYFKTEWNCYYFSLLGKCFGMLNDDSVTLKGDPEENIYLRNKYEDIIPGYHTNKKHWNTINLNSIELTSDDYESMIHKSYKLVYKKLTKIDKEIVEEM